MADTNINLPSLEPTAAEAAHWLPDETRTLGGGRPEITFASTRGSFQGGRGLAALAPVIEIDRLYDAVPGSASHMVTALELLKEAAEHLAYAQRCDNPVEADRAVQRVQAGLPKLFACRSIGDGFGIVVNSVHYAFANLHGRPLSATQMNIVWRVLRELRARPAITVEQGVEFASELEAQGLEVDPPGLTELLDDSASNEDE